MTLIRRVGWVMTLGGVLACGSPGGGADGSDSSTSAAGTAGEPTSETSAGTADDGRSSPTTTSSADETGDPPKLDVEFATGDETGPPPPACKVVGDMDAVGACVEQATADSFAPAVQWEWSGPTGVEQASAIPLVANFTDDNGDGEIDLCDTPDVVVVLDDGPFTGTGSMWLLDGATGAVHFEFEAPVNGSVTPALGDIDDDGLPEVVTMSGAGMLAFEHDGSLKWTAPTPTNSNFCAVALADLDNDADVEIIVGNFVADHEGNILFSAQDWFWQPAAPIYLSATTAADLDGDGDLEVVMGRSAWHHDGTPLFNLADQEPGYPQVANLDDDPQPEILVTSLMGLTVLEHDGAVKYQNLRPTGDSSRATNWLRPATVHDFDGDGIAEYATSSATHYSAFEADASILWMVDVAEPSCCAAGTAFDFLGDGVAEAMYADETTMWMLDGLAGEVVFSQPRSSWTNIEYPVVADVDNDGSAEIIVVSNTHDGGMTSPTVQVFRDAEDRWIQARRIWNQHTYHVTNVREDGTLPQFEPPSWTELNTFRTNAQIEGGGLCIPEPEA